MLETNGLMTSRKGTTHSWATTYGYDALGRLTSTTDPRSGVIDLTTYDPAIGQVTATSRILANSPTQTTSYHYYGNGTQGAGQMKRTVNPAGQWTRYAFDSQGQMAYQWGIAGFPIKYEYTAYGQLWKMSTYRSGTAWSSDSDAVPSGSDGFGGAGQTTIWAYYPGDGYLLSKTAPSGVTGDGVTSYDYYANGQLMTKNERGLTTNYSYSWGDDGGWDTGGRHYTIGAANFSSSGALAYFNYHNKSDLPAATTFYNTYPLTLMTSSRTYDGFNRLQSVSNKIGYTSTVINSHTYTFDAAGRRSTATVETGDVWNWSYNNRGEVTDAKKAWSGGGYLRGRTFTYGYDNIGNRTTHSSGGTTAGGTTRTVNYTINPDGTNEIQTIANPSSFDVTGLASGSVTVGNNPVDTAQTQGNFFHADRNETGEAGKVQPGLREVVVAVNGTTVQQGNVYVPEVTEATSYDGSGNLTSDSRWTYTWTEDNRLREISTRSTSGIANSSAACVRVAFDYDYLGRRVQKRTYINYNWNTPGSGTLQKTVKYVWDGWNCIAELNGADSKFFIWGPDLSGDTGAGGVGGLLFVQDLSGSYTLETNHCVAYDGNGNVTAIVDGMSGSGAVEAAYEYDPFGNPIRQSGPYALTNPFRFSTKFTDDESGLVYYGYRYYDPVRGRWPSRDPSEEDGGFNLYGMVGNNPVNMVDVLGQHPSVDRYGRFWSPFAPPLPPPAPAPPQNGGESQIKEILLSILDASFHGTRQCFNKCFPTLNPLVQACVSVCGRVEITGCCNEKNRVCLIGDLTVEGGLFARGTHGPRTGPSPPVGNWVAPISLRQIMNKPKSPGRWLKVPFAHGLKFGNCPKEAITGHVSATASVGVWSYSAGVRGSLHFPGGDLRINAGMGVGQGTGLSVGGGVTFTHCMDAE